MPEDEPDKTAEETAEDNASRREFLSKAGSVVIGGAIVVVPVGAGLATLLAPMTAETGAGLDVRLASVDEIPDDGTPRLYQVVAPRTDAWTRYRAKPLGGVFIRKDSEGKVVAFHSSCPHAGCSVAFKSKEEGYFCPCHSSVFNLDGSRATVCVSPRGLDSLEVDQRKLEDGEVWVKFVNFKAGVEDKIATS